MEARQHIPQKIREQVKAKFGGRCAYCGEVPKQMHIDHLVPVARAHMRRDFDVNAFENLMPACAPCNNYKMSFDLEQFRTELQRQATRARAHSVNFRLLERFGKVTVDDSPIVFHFEKPAPRGDGGGA